MTIPDPRSCRSCPDRSYTSTVHPTRVSEMAAAHPRCSPPTTATRLPAMFHRAPPVSLELESAQGNAAPMFADSEHSAGPSARPAGLCNRLAERAVWQLLAGRHYSERQMESARATRAYEVRNASFMTGPTTWSRSTPRSRVAVAGARKAPFTPRTIPPPRRPARGRQPAPRSCAPATWIRTSAGAAWQRCSLASLRLPPGWPDSGASKRCAPRQARGCGARSVRTG